MVLAFALKAMQGSIIVNLASFRETWRIMKPTRSARDAVLVWFYQVVGQPQDSTCTSGRVPLGRFVEAPIGNMARPGSRAAMWVVHMDPARFSITAGLHRAD